MQNKSSIYKVCINSHQEIMLELLKVISILENIEEYLYIDGPKSRDTVDYSMVYTSFMSIHQTIEKLTEKFIGE